MEQVWCNSCLGETTHNTLYTHDGVSGGMPECKVVACGGCKTHTVIHFQYERSTDGALRECCIYEPPRSWTKHPRWMSDLETIDPDMHSLMQEVYTAANPKQLRLLCMGVRCVLDRLMDKLLGADHGDFPTKLNLMAEKGFVSSTQHEWLKIVVDAGSAAAHRAFKPHQEHLKHMVDITEGLVRDHYITGPMLKTMRTMIPPRPPRPEPK